MSIFKSLGLRVSVAVATIGIVAYAVGVPAQRSMIESRLVGATRTPSSGAGSSWSATSGTLGAALAADDSNCATHTTNNAQALTASDLGFTIPTTATITGVSVHVLSGFSPQPGTSTLTVNLTGAGTSTAKTPYAPALAASCGAVSSTGTTLGGASDTWSSTALTVANVNSGTFGVTMVATTDKNTSKFIDLVEVTVHYQNVAPPTPSSVGPAPNGVVTSASPTISGSGAIAGATVTVSVDGVVVGTTIALGDGTWSLTLTGTPLSDGAHTTTAQQTDPDGGDISTPSSALGFTVDSIAPPVPAISTPADNAVVGTPTTFTGTCGEEGSTILLFVDGIQQTNTTTCTGGVWTIVSDTQVDGTHTATARARDGASNASADSAGKPFNVDSTLGPS